MPFFSYRLPDRPLKTQLHQRKTGRSLRLEQLENRQLLASDIGLLLDASSMTLSILPDGAKVGQSTNNINTKMQGVGEENAWKIALAKAVQTWVNETQINIGYTSDDGSEMGVYGPQFGNAEYGDIRIAGFETQLNVIAEAIPVGVKTVGAWAGNVLFNTAATWTESNHFQHVAIHELGHVLGLDHSDEPGSVMHAHRMDGTTVLAPDDITKVRALHGMRAPDGNEGATGNDTLTDATVIGLSDDSQAVAYAFNGNQTWTQFGDLLNASDIDYYKVATDLNYDGPIAFQIRSSGLSMAHLTVQLVDGFGNILKASQVEGIFGGITTLTLPSSTPLSEYYLRVSSPDDAFWASGRYAVTISTPAKLVASADDIWHQTYTASRRYNANYGTIDESNYMSPHSLSSNSIIPAAYADNGSSIARVYGNMAELATVREFQFQSPTTLSGPMEMLIDVTSVGGKLVVPVVTVLDSAGNEITLDVRQKRWGQFVGTSTQVQLDSLYTLRLSLPPGVLPQSNEYALTVVFHSGSKPLVHFVSGTLNEDNPQLAHRLTVEKAQVFGFTITSQSTTPEAASVIFSIRDDNLELIQFLTVSANDLRSGNGVLLQPGEYHILIAAYSLAGLTADISVSLDGDKPTQFIGPSTGDPPTGNDPPFEIEPEVPPPPIPLPIPTPVPLPELPPPPTFTDFRWFIEMFDILHPELGPPISGLDTTSQLSLPQAQLLIDALMASSFGSPYFPTEASMMDSDMDGQVSSLEAYLALSYLYND